ncbi:hypothetical protein PtB15_13B460 [Puccinia triticina]|nr:hypothetical protein PtB15_13B460 [Puccinia triticina]
MISWLLILVFFSCSFEAGTTNLQLSHILEVPQAAAEPVGQSPITHPSNKGFDIGAAECPEAIISIHETECGSQLSNTGYSRSSQNTNAYSGEKIEDECDKVDDLVSSKFSDKSVAEIGCKEKEGEIQLTNTGNLESSHRSIPVDLTNAGEKIESKSTISQELAAKTRNEVVPKIPWYNNTEIRFIILVCMCITGLGFLLKYGPV